MRGQTTFSSDERVHGSVVPSGFFSRKSRRPISARTCLGNLEYSSGFAGVKLVGVVTNMASEIQRAVSTNVLEQDFFMIFASIVLYVADGEREIYFDFVVHCAEKIRKREFNSRSDRNVTLILYIYILNSRMEIRSIKLNLRNLRTCTSLLKL